MAALVLINDINTWYDPAARRQALDLAETAAAEADRAAVSWAELAKAAHSRIASGSDTKDDWAQTFDLLTACRDAAGDWVLARLAEE
ncbi:hypothetical protein [Botrimarina mediterranea]|uniref:Uncharacterized protein n=1 Tax=Botrimarina mediterranea TaxID=2528022 RepID=A0A518KCB1_9BACT|nr:hypothetical protein [Botrimarina mediterranea]QDV75408.1 hypothetical protein Spa11_36250 [Botrimarina mediterranea]